MRRVLILGSTGSIGRQALDVIAQNPEQFCVVGVGGNTHADIISQQSEAFKCPGVCGIEDNIALINSLECDVIVNAITGAVGLEVTLAALETSATLALANKESLVAAGEIVMNLPNAQNIVAIDSEHSALAQALRSGQKHEVKRLILTASGGPFRGMSRAQLQHVTLQQALAHPTWNMGPVITTNSATLVNKGLEIIEAHHLFGVDYDRIGVTVHPQSIVHSLVEFIDGSCIAQASNPDMKLPISLALTWPERTSQVIDSLEFANGQTWSFEPLDHAVFPAVALAKHVGKLGKTFPAVYNAANEQAVDAFRRRILPFLDIVEIIQRVVDAHVPEQDFTIESVFRAQDWARNQADEFIVFAAG